MMEKFGVKTIGILLEFLHLGNAIEIMTPFDAINKKATVLRIKPTLSPRDPNFQSWWAQHKSEWETPKRDGQEPGDD